MCLAVILYALFIHPFAYYLTLFPWTDKILKLYPQTVQRERHKVFLQFILDTTMEASMADGRRRELFLVRGYESEHVSSPHAMINTAKSYESQLRFLLLCGAALLLQTDGNSSVNTTTSSHHDIVPRYTTLNPHNYRHHVFNLQTQI